MTTIRQRTKEFLADRVSHSPWLLQRWTPELETQIMVHKGRNEIDTNTWEDNGEIFSNHRWPYRASTDPQYTDKKLTFDFPRRVARVGSTWWNWEKRESVAVGFDIDAEDSGHAAGTNQLDTFKLGQVVAKLSELDYVTLVRSTGGKGVHGYVFFDEGSRPSTSNHNEHTQVGLAVIDKIRQDTGMDMIDEKIVDVKGVILWMWADSSDENHPGFTLIKEATRNLTEDEIPNWQEMATKRAVKKGDANYQSNELDDEHIEILSELEDIEGWSYQWIDGYSMAHTHTLALKTLFEKRKNEGRPLKGFFETTSTGSTPINCYITPRPGGVFKVARFGNSVAEHESWYVKDDDTWFYFNQKPDPMSVISNYALTYDMASAVIEPEPLKAALDILGVEDFELPDVKQFSLVYDASNGTITASCRHRDEMTIPSGWVKSGRKISAKIPVDGSEETRTQNYLDEIDETFRFVVQPDFTVYGWFHKSQAGWIRYDSSGPIIRPVQQQFGKKAADEVVSMMQNNPWILGNEPFKGDELPGRLWNHQAATLVCEPADKPGPHPHFDKILHHLGQGLDEAVAHADWTGEWGMETGADYLRYWIASAVKYPFEPLPYLFFFGPQGCGKSIYVETLSMLFPRACRDVSHSLTTEFNGELRGAVFCYIEEKNLTGRGLAQKSYERIKEWTVARNVSIHTKGKTPYMVPNTMKFIHMANNINSIKIDRDDTRIVAVDVPRLINPIPKSIMTEKLKEEAPNILRTLLTTVIPPAIERMRVPHINTVAKLELGEASMSDVQKFAMQMLQSCSGNLIDFQTFQDMYGKWAKEKNAMPMGKNGISSELRKMDDFLTVGKKGKDNKTFIANVKFKGDSSASPGKKVILLENGRLG